MEISNIGFGTYRLGDKTYESVLNAIKYGYNHIDTAPLYKNEAIVGDAIKSIEKDIVRGELLKTGNRIDGRDTKTVRAIKCEVGVLERTPVK